MNVRKLATLFRRDQIRVDISMVHRYGTLKGGCVQPNTRVKNSYVMEMSLTYAAELMFTAAKKMLTIQCHIYHNHKDPKEGAGDLRKPLTFKKYLINMTPTFVL